MRSTLFVMMRSINEAYVPRILGVYYDLSRRTYHRMIYPFRQLGSEGYPIGWTENVRLCRLDTYDIVLFLEPEDCPVPDEDVLYAKQLGKVVLIDSRSSPLGEPGIDTRIWPEIPEREETLGLFVDRSMSLTSGLLNALKQRMLPLVGGNRIHDFYATFYDDTNIYRHPDRLNGSSFLLLPSSDPRSYDVWEAGMARTVVIAHEAYRPYVGRYGYYVQDDNWSESIQQAIQDTRRSERYRRQLHFYVTEHRNYAATLGALTKLWASKYREKLGSFHEVKTI